MNSLGGILNWHRQVARLFGIPISIHITIVFFLLPALTGWGLGIGYGIEYAVLLVLSILAHELGHALTAKRYGMSGLSIMLHGFGGFATSSGYRKPKQALMIVLMGPAVTFVIAAIGMIGGKYGMQSVGLNRDLFIQFALLHTVGFVNLLMGILNLMPMLPFDGGHALQAVLTFRQPEFKAMRNVAHLGLPIGVALFIYGFVAHMDLVMLFAIVGFLASLSTLLQTGGVRFGEPFADRRARQEMQAQRAREAARHREYVDDVQSREKRRQEQERLRKILGESPDDE